jgi:hypothetical protein
MSPGEAATRHKAMSARTSSERRPGAPFGKKALRRSYAWQSAKPRGGIEWLKKRSVWQEKTMPFVQCGHERFATCWWRTYYMCNPRKLKSFLKNAHG